MNGGESTVNKEVGDNKRYGVLDFSSTSNNETRYERVGTSKEYRVGYALTVSAIAGAVGAIFLPVAGITPPLMFTILGGTTFVLGSALGLFSMEVDTYAGGGDYDEVETVKSYTFDDIKKPTPTKKKEESFAPQSELLRLENEIKRLKGSQLRLSGSQKEALDVLTKAYEQKMLSSPSSKQEKQLRIER